MRAAVRVPGSWTRKVCSSCSQIRTMPRVAGLCGFCEEATGNAQRTYRLVAVPGLREAVDASGLTLKRLQFVSGVSQATISRALRGKLVLPSTVEKLAWALGREVGELLG